MHEKLASGSCFTLNHLSLANNIYKQQGSGNFQWWRVFARGCKYGDAFELQNTQSGKLLCIQSRSQSNNARAILYHDQELSFQKWHLSLESSDQIRIRNAHSSLTLCVQGRSTNDGGKVIQYENQRKEFQWWRFIRLSGEMDLIKLISFFEHSHLPQTINPPDIEMSTEQLWWYQKFIETFALEVLRLLGEFPMPR